MHTSPSSSLQPDTQADAPQPLCSWESRRTQLHFALGEHANILYGLPDDATERQVMGRLVEFLPRNNPTLEEMEMVVRLSKLVPNHADAILSQLRGFTYDLPNNNPLYWPAMRALAPIDAAAARKVKEHDQEHLAALSKDSRHQLR